MNTQNDGNVIPPENEEREDRHGPRVQVLGGWFAGAVLLIIGVFLLLRNLNLTTFTLNNWWALFILIPAAGAYGNAWQHYQYAGKRFTREASGSLFGGLVLTLVAAIFLFGWNWGTVWPALLIVAGGGMLVSGMLRQ